jgi:hypothetical protein
MRQLKLTSAAADVQSIKSFSKRIPPTFELRDILLLELSDKINPWIFCGNKSMIVKYLKGKQLNNQNHRDIIAKDNNSFPDHHAGWLGTVNYDERHLLSKTKLVLT